MHKVLKVEPRELKVLQEILVLKVLKVLKDHRQMPGIKQMFNL